MPPAMFLPLFSICFCLLLAQMGLAVSTGHVSFFAAGGRRLLGAKEEMKSADRQPGKFRDWVVQCEGSRQRCPNLFLASWGYQCTNEEGDSCCLKPNGKSCTRLSGWEDAAKPDSWTGRDLSGGDDGGKEAASGEEADSQVEEEEREAGEATKRGSKPRGNKKQSEQMHAGAADGHEEKERGRSSRDDGSSSWNMASATVFWSYPDCCNDSNADQSECDDYSGCKWEGMFAGLDGKQTKSWVKSNDIAAFFEPPNSRNRKEWDRKWRNKQLRIRNPATGKTMEVTIYDTCDDNDCSGCCTENARRHGGQLVDLEYHTAKRFWGDNVPDVAPIEWQLA